MNAESRTALKRKPLEALEPPPQAQSPTSEQIQSEHEFTTKYGTDVVHRLYFKELMDGATRLLKQGAINWLHDVKKLRTFYMEISTFIPSWSMDYLIVNLDVLSEDRIHAIIASVDGFCVQTDWETLLPMLPSTVRVNSAHAFGELLMHLAIKERLFESPFWYLDGKRRASDPGEDPTFAEKMNYLFERTYEKRHEAALPALADSLLASEPFCWLLKEDLMPDKIETRHAELIDVFRKAVRTMISCETWTNGIPVFRGIEELGGIFRGKSDFITLHLYTYRPRRDLYINQAIIVVARRGLV
ncbi:hypothetical protein BJX66DRAFT_330188 [Aspergillus keveii]|uniref:Uncharacterized protein n=1 Tax=Aspergillus keveii TaxID=714993 RepID=A0ABR4FLJ7_9EURO